MEYQKLVTAQTEGDMDTINALLHNHTNVVQTESGLVVESYQEQMQGASEMRSVLESELAKATAAGDKEYAKQIRTMMNTLNQEEAKTKSSYQNQAQTQLQQLQKMSSNSNSMLGKILNSASSFALNLSSQGTKAGSGFTSNTAGSMDVSKVSGKISSIKSTVNIAGTLGSYGSNAGSSFMSNLTSSMYNSSGLFSALDSLISRVRSKLQINSPSKVFARIGDSVGEGFDLGVGRLFNRTIILRIDRNRKDNISATQSLSQFWYYKHCTSTLKNFLHTLRLFFFSFDWRFEGNGLQIGDKK